MAWRDFIGGLGLVGALAASLAAAPGVDVSVQALNHGGAARFENAIVAFHQGARTVKAPLDSGGRATVNIAPGSWEVSCAGPGVYCPTVLRSIREPKLTVDAFGLTEAIALLVVPQATTLPETLAVQGVFFVSDDRSSRQTFEYRTVAKVQTGRASFRLPTSRQDLRLGAEGFAPTYRFGLEAKPGKHDLGELNLRPGSSLFGVAFEPGSDEPAAGVEIRVEPLAPTGVGASGKLLRKTTRTSDRGVFQLTDLTPSRYRLVLIRGGKEVGSLSPIEIPPNSEVRMDAVRLVAPATARFKLTPAITPNEKPWSVSLKQLSADLAGVPLDLSEKSTPEGEVQFTSLSPGPYQLFVRDEKGSRLFYERLEIAGDIDRSIDLPLSTVRGRIRLGSSPLKAHLGLGSGDFDESSLDSDDQGRFEGVIRTPTRGALFAIIESKEPAFSRRLVVKDAKVDVARRTVEVEINLEDKVIDGRVTTALGKGIPGLAVVAIADQLNMIETISRADGSFEIRPADSALYSVSLRRGGKGVGKTYQADLTTTDRATLAMSIDQYRKAQFRVLSASGDAVPAARLYVKAVGYAGMTLQTDATGSAEAIWPVGVERGFVSASSGSAPAMARCITVPDPTNPDPESLVDVPIHLPPLPGAKIHLVPDESSTDQPLIVEDELLVVSRTGGVWRRNEVQSLSGSGGLPPGEYAAVWNRGPIGGLVDQVCSVGPPASVRWTAVGFGQEITIQYPRPGKPPARQSSPRR